MPLLFDYLNLNEDFATLVDKINRNLRSLEEKYGPQGNSGLPGFVGLPGRPGFKGTQGERGFSDKFILMSSGDFNNLFSTPSSFNQYYEILYEYFGVLTEDEKDRLINEDPNVDEILEKIEYFEDIVNSTTTDNITLNIYLVIQGSTMVRELTAISKTATNVSINWTQLGNLVDVGSIGPGGESLFRRLPNVPALDPLLDDNLNINYLSPNEVLSGVSLLNLYRNPIGEINVINRGGDVIPGNVPIRNILDYDLDQLQYVDDSVKLYDHKFVVTNNIVYSSNPNVSFAPLLLLGNVHKYTQTDEYRWGNGNFIQPLMNDNFYGGFFSIGIHKEIVSNQLQRHEFSIIPKGPIPDGTGNVDHEYSVGLYSRVLKIYSRQNNYVNPVTVENNNSNLIINSINTTFNTGITTLNSTSGTILSLSGASDSSSLRVLSSGGTTYTIRPTAARNFHLSSLSSGVSGVYMSNTGLVGINTTSPNRQLHVSGSGRITERFAVGTDITNDVVFRLFRSMPNLNDGDTLATIRSGGGNIGSGHVVGLDITTHPSGEGFGNTVCTNLLSVTRSSGSILGHFKRVDTTTHEVMIIRANGRVGLGTTEPTDRLTVIDNTTGRYITQLTQNHDNGFGLRIDISPTTTSTNSALLVVKGTSQLFRVSQNGRVGINESSPSEALDISGDLLVKSTSTSTITSQFTGNSGQSQIIFKAAGYTKDSAAIRTVGTSGNRRKGLGFYTNNSTNSTSPALLRMIIQANGLVGIGIDSSVHRLTVSHATYNSQLRVHRAATGFSVIEYTNNDGVLGQAGFNSSEEFIVRTGTSNTTRIEVGGSLTTLIGSSEMLRLYRDTDQTANSYTSWITWHGSGGRAGYIGFGSTSNKNLTLANDTGNIIFRPDNNERVVFRNTSATFLTNTFIENTVSGGQGATLRLTNNSGTHNSTTVIEFQRSNISNTGDSIMGKITVGSTSNSGGRSYMIFSTYEQNTALLERMRIDVNGRVGIGTDSPNSALHVNGTVTATTFSGNVTGNVTGNATTATTLQTARTINGTSFNGSGNITTANWGTSRNIVIGNTTKAVNGSSNVSWSLSEIGVNNSTLTLATSGIATGSQTWTSNQGSDSTFTVNVPATNLGSSGTGGTRTITSSTGANTSITFTAANVGAVPTSRTLTGGDGINTIGALDANRTISVDNTVIRTTGEQSLTQKTFFNGRFKAVDLNQTNASARCEIIPIVYYYENNNFPSNQWNETIVLEEFAATNNRMIRTRLDGIITVEIIETGGSTDQSDWETVAGPTTTTITNNINVNLDQTLINYDGGGLQALIRLRRVGRQLQLRSETVWQGGSANRFIFKVYVSLLAHNHTGPTGYTSR